MQNLCTLVYAALGLTAARFIREFGNNSKIKLRNAAVHVHDSRRRIGHPRFFFSLKLKDTRLFY